jgi:hypothetical protein
MAFIPMQYVTGDNPMMSDESLKILHDSFWKAYPGGTLNYPKKIFTQ